MKLIKKAIQNIPINSSSLNCQNIIVTIGCLNFFSAADIINLNTKKKHSLNAGVVNYN